MEHSEDTDRAAVFAANAEFYRAFADGDFPAMTALWAEREPIVCIHPGWPPVSGRSDVLASWRGILADPPQPPVRPSDEQVYLMGEAAMVVCFESIGEVFLAATNVFLREGGAWRLVHHHAGVTEHRPRSVRAAPRATLH
jgi:ketosteroid isomerase-like protein